MWLNGASETEEPLCVIADCRSPLGWTYPYCRKHLSELFGVCVKRSKVHGLGLFATRDFAKNERVVPYGGELVKSQQQLNCRYSSTQSPNCTASYAVKVKQGYVDALRLRHAWVYANHSDGRPNCMMTSDGIKTQRSIKAGTELLVDYGREFEFQGRVSYFVLA